VLRSLVASNRRYGLSFIHYSAMSNHLHLLCEAESSEAIAKGMGSFLITLSLALDGTWGRKGRVFADRYHSRALETPLEVHRALAYVLLNARNHGIRHVGVFDPFSSARWFEGWTQDHPASREALDPNPLPRAKTWLLVVGAGLHGRIDPCIDRDVKRHAPRRDGHRSPAGKAAGPRGLSRRNGPTVAQSSSGTMGCRGDMHDSPFADRRIRPGRGHANLPAQIPRAPRSNGYLGRIGSGP
jgi:hypothetical protein